MHALLGEVAHHGRLLTPHPYSPAANTVSSKRTSMSSRQATNLSIHPTLHNQCGESHCGQVALPSMRRV